MSAPGVPGDSLALHDALLELFNVGIGRAAASLAQLAGDEIALSLPWLELTPRQDVRRRLLGAHTGDVAAVLTTLMAPFQGNALMVFPEGEGLRLARLLAPAPETAAHLSAADHDLLLEVGNIVLNAVIGSLANQLGAEIVTHNPVWFDGPAEQVLGAAGIPLEQGDDVVLLCIDLTLLEPPLTTHVLLLLDVGALDALEQAIAQILRALPA